MKRTHVPAQKDKGETVNDDPERVIQLPEETHFTDLGNDGFRAAHDAAGDAFFRVWLNNLYGDHQIPALDQRVSLVLRQALDNPRGLLNSFPVHDGDLYRHALHRQEFIGAPLWNAVRLYAEELRNIQGDATEIALEARMRVMNSCYRASRGAATEALLRSDRLPGPDTWRPRLPGRDSVTVTEAASAPKIQRPSETAAFSDPQIK